MRGTLDHLRFEVVKYERNASDNAESKVYLSKKLLPEVVHTHRSARTVVEIRDRLVHLVQWVEGGGQVDFAFSRKRHQLHQIGVRAHQVADNVLLAEDHVNRRDLDGAAVADDVVVATVAGHGQALIDGPAFANKVEDSLGALPTRELKHLAHCVVSAPADQVLGPQFLGKAQSQVRAFHHDDLSRALGAEHLVGDVAKAAKADDHREVAGLKDLGRLVGRVIGREAGVGVRSDLLGRNVVGKVD